MSAVRLLRAVVATLALSTGLTVAAAQPAQASDVYYFGWGGASDFDETSFTWGSVIPVARLQFTNAGYAHSHLDTVVITVSLLPDNVPVYTGTLAPNESRTMNIDVQGYGRPANGISVSSAPAQSQTFHNMAGTTVVVTGAHGVPVPAPAPACGDGLDNDLDGRVDYPNDPGCSWYDDNDEYNATTPAPCPTVLGVPVCTTVTTDNVFQSVPVSNVVLGTAATHQVNGWIDIYKFQLPTGGSANVPCVIVKVNNTTSNPCALAGGAFLSRFATLVDQPVQQPSAGLSGTLATVRVCHARVTVTAASIGVENFPAYTVC